MNTFSKNLNPRAFDAIKAGTKRIEIRANKNSTGKTSFNNIKEGDFIIFQKKGFDEKLKCLVKRKTLYKSVKELLEKEGTKYTLSSTNDIEKGIQSIESIGDYKRLIAKNGVFAVEIEYPC